MTGRRLNQEDVRQKFIAAGYIPDNDFAYRNNKQKHRVFDILNNKYVRVSLQQLNYHVGKGNRPLWEQPPMPAGEPENEPLTSLERFTRHHDQAFQQLPIEAQQDTFNDYQQLRRSIGRKRDFDYVFHDADSEAAQTTQMRAIVLALQDSMPAIAAKGLSIRLKITTTNGLERYFHVNATTLSDLWLMFSNVEPDFSVEDSSGNFALSTLNIATIHFTFKKSTKGKQVAAGFFPYVGERPGENLERYGIYSIDNLAKAVEPCLLTAFRASNIMTDNELQQLQEMINVREFPQRYLKNISEHFNISIYVRLYRDGHYNGNDEQGKSKSSHVEFKPANATRDIKLMIMHGHYMLYEMINRRSNYQLIKDMIKAGQLRPYTDKELEQLYAAVATQPRSRPQSTYTNSRPKVVKIPSSKPRISNRFYGEHLFGYKPEADEIDERLDQLQKFVNSLPLRHHVNVRDYFKFSMLMERIMYEFGCFDNVHELSGQLRDDIRASLVFPKRSEPPAELTNDHYYYLDFNGAYCSFMDRIPSGTSAAGDNTKIKQLIELMYEKRLNADKRLAKTIKFLMCSCFGSSISKPKTHKHKWSDNIEATIRNQGNLVAAHADGSSGFVTLLNPYVEHYSYPQFAKVILDGFNNKVNELKSIVNVLFQNIDAFVVNEADYKKLLELGYIHPTELGKLKVEHVFTKMTFKNKMRWVGINEDGTEFRHCM